MLPFFKPFLKSADGAVAIIFALATIPLLAAVGVAVDYSRVAAQRTILQQAVDVTALAVARAMDKKTTSELRSYAGEFLTAQLAGRFPAEITKFVVNKDTREIDIAAEGSMRTLLIGLFQRKDVAFNATASAIDSLGNVEVVMALDNSGSMAGQRIIDLRAAAEKLVTILYSAPKAAERVKIGLVPFAALVNVGPGNAGASWMDTGAQSPVHSENFQTAANRFTLYKTTMKEVSWAGCVEARPNGHDVLDTAPSAGNASTLFVPTFAPDEPDNRSDRSDDNGYVNSYLGDEGGSCKSSDNTDKTPSVRQKKLCKYSGVKPNQAIANGTIQGPNHLCDTAPIQPLTGSQSTITNAIKAMTARGGTNINEGLAWAWRVISPGAPFTDGAPYSDRRVTKNIVLMSDGANQMLGIGSSNHNKSYYSAWGFSAANRLGTTSSSSSTLKSKMDDRLKTLCENVKKAGTGAPDNGAGIRLYTINFDVSDSTSTKILKACATNPDEDYFEVSANESLSAAFEKIARSIGKPRLTK